MPVYINKSGTTAYVMKNNSLTRVPLNSTIELTEAEARNATGFSKFDEEDLKPKGPIQIIKKKVKNYANDTIKGVVEKLLPELMGQLRDDLKSDLSKLNDNSSDNQSDEVILELNKKLDLLLNRDPQQVIIQQSSGEVGSTNFQQPKEELYIPDIKIDNDTTGEVRMNIDLEKSSGDDVANSLAALKKLKKKK